MFSPERFEQDLVSRDSHRTEDVQFTSVDGVWSPRTSAHDYAAAARQILSRAYLYVTLAWVVLIAAMGIGWKIGYADALLQSQGLFWTTLIASYVLLIGVVALAKSAPIWAMRTAFLGFATLQGLIISTVLTEVSVLLVAEALFATLAVTVGITIVALKTRVDLTRFDSLFLTLLLVLIPVLVVEMFIASNGFVLAVSVILVLVFTAMIAWDTHNILHMADEALKSGEQVEFERIAIKGAADLFVDTLVIFLRVLMILSIITGGGD